MDHVLAWTYAEELSEEPLEVARARSVAASYGTSSISAATGAFLRFYVRMSGARTIAEIGTGAGVSGLYFLGADPSVQLTSLDSDADVQHAARESFVNAGVKPSQFRLIQGRSADLLPRLASASYDLVFLDGDPLETPGDFLEALRLLRTGGTIVIAHALVEGKVADPARREEDVVAMRNLCKETMESEALDAVLLPVGDGLLLVRKA